MRADSRPPLRNGMHKTLLVAWQQIKKIVLHWSFLIIVLYPPLIAGFLGLYLAFIGWVVGLERESDSLPAPGVITTNNVAFDRAVGLVDQAGLITMIPADLTTEKLLTYPDEAAARAAVAAGDIAGYYLIPAGYVAEGVVTYLSLDSVQYSETDEAINKLLTLNLAAADGEDVARRVAAPVEFAEKKLTLPGGPPPEAPGTYTPVEVGVGLGIAAFVYFTVGSVCSLFLNQMARERQGRVLEVILGAMTPLQLLTGKFIGIVIVGLLETGAWLFWVRLFSSAGMQLAALNGGGSVPELPSAFHASTINLTGGAEPRALILSGLIFTGGYFAYVAMAAVLGAVTENTRQASRISFLLTTVAMSPLVWMINVLSAPEGALALFLSLFPLSSPIIMPLRIFTSAVPLWQVLLSFALLIGWTGLMLWLSARLFNARLLLHSQPLRAMVRGRVRQLTGKAAADSSSSARSRA